MATLDDLYGITGLGQGFQAGSVVTGLGNLYKPGVFEGTATTYKQLNKGSHPYDTDYNNLGPRIGVAYQVADKTVLRGSYGIFYGLDRGGIDNQLTANPPYTVVQFRFGGTGSNVRLSDPIPVPLAVDPNNPVLPDGAGVVYLPRDTQTSQYQQFNFGFQRELSDKTAVSAFYVGTRGDNLTAIVSQAGFSGEVQGRLTTVSNIATSSYDSLRR